MKRCEWIQDKPDFYVDYHDHVWGKPEHNDRQLFKWLILEMFHIGLSWQLVLSKEENFAKAFDDYDYQLIARYNEADILRLMDDAGIIRHRKKIEAAIQNAKAFLGLQAEWGSFNAFIWHFTNGETVFRAKNEPMKASSDLSDQVTAILKQAGFKFLGSVTVYSYLQAIGMINDHDWDCEFR